MEAHDSRTASSSSPIFFTPWGVTTNNGYALVYTRSLSRVDRRIRTLPIGRSFAPVGLSGVMRLNVWLQNQLQQGQIYTAHPRMQRLYPRNLVIPQNQTNIL